MRVVLVCALVVLTASCARMESGPSRPADVATTPAILEPEPREARLRSLRQLTLSGENAEAYWSADGSRLIFQAHEGQGTCDQIFTMRADGTDVRQVSTGGGRTTCAYYFPSGDRILYSSTRHVGPDCPPEPDMSRGYVWGLYDYDIYVARADGSEPVPITRTPGYDAEATLSPDGSRIVFTSVRDGDLDIYTMNPDGAGVVRLTDTPGYDGGPFFSPDGTKIVYRAHHPTDPAELTDYRSLLARSHIRPTRLEIWVMDADGSNKRQLTSNGAANFAPYFHPDGRRILFASNQHEPRGRNFDLYLIGIDGTGLERVTWHDAFDSFPMFSPDGRRLVWASNRNQAKPGDTNIFVAEWVEDVP